jgi:hypothetical protein
MASSSKKEPYLTKFDSIMITFYFMGSSYIMYANTSSVFKNHHRKSKEYLNIALVENSTAHLLKKHSCLNSFS